MRKITMAGVTCLTFCAVSLGSATALAELFINPVGKAQADQSHLSFHFGSSSVDYEVAGAKGEIDRTFLGATYVQGLDETLDVFATASLILESEIEGASNDGDGYLLGGGLRTNIRNDLDVDLSGYAQILYISEDYGSSADGDEKSILMGIAASKALDQYISLYGAVEFNLWSDMDIQGFDSDRDDIMGFRIGANLKQDQYLLNVNLAFGHETGVYISGSKPF